MLGNTVSVWPVDGSGTHRADKMSCARENITALDPLEV